MTPTTFGDLRATGIIFISVLALAILFFVAWRRSRKFWLCIDLFWLAVAGLALLSATAQVRQLVAGWDSDQLARDIPGLKQGAFNLASNYSRLFRKGFPYDNWQDRVLVARFQAAGSWFEDAAKSVEAGQHREFARTHRVMLAEDPDDIVRQKQIVLSSIDQVIRMEDRLSAANLNRQRSDSEQTMFLFTPWILAVALALRISKVFAELVGYKTDLQHQKTHAIR